MSATVVGKLTPPIAGPAKPIDFGPLPETLSVLAGAMEIRRHHIKQAWPESHEYWSCQRDLAAIERRWAEAEKVWAEHIAKGKEK